MITFREATDDLLRDTAISMTDLGKVFNLHPHTLYRARMSGENARSAPDAWEVVVARIAREHAVELQDHARQLLHLAERLEHQAIPRTP